MAEEKPRELPHPGKPDAIGYYDIYLEVRVFINLRPYGGDVIPTVPPANIVESLTNSFHGHKRTLPSDKKKEQQGADGDDTGGQQNNT